MKKKITRLSVFSVILLIALLIALPHLMEEKVGSLLKENVNGQIVGSFDFSKIKLSLYKDFPHASVSLEYPSIINIEPFRGDTLFAADKLELKLGITEFFEGADDPIEIKEFIVQGARLNLKLNDSGLANYDIAIPSESEEVAAAPEQNTIFALNSYQISDSRISYNDAESGTELELSDFNHKGSGEFSADSSELLTETQSLISLYIDNKPYLEQNKLQLTALLGIDLETNTYSFKENVVILNELPVKFEGYIRPMEEVTEMDLSFSTISSDFRNFLAMIPERYTTDISLLETMGNFDLAGKVSGQLGDKIIPEFNLKMKADDASFKFPDLKKRVEHIYIDALVANSTGDIKDTEIAIENAGFQIDQDTFQVRARITELLGNTNVNSHLKGRLDLEKLSEAYPIPSSIDMSGLVTADINSSFSLNDIDQKRYKNIQLDGLLDIKGLFYDFQVLPQPLRIHTLEADLNSKSVQLREMAGVSGNTDFALDGKLENILGYLFNEEELIGDLDIRSNSFVVADLIDESEVEEEDAETSEQPFKVPANLNFKLSAIVGKAIYDDIVMYDLAGNVRIKDEVITFNDLSTRMLDGRMAAEGVVSTKGEEPEFNMELDMSKIDISKSFATIDLVSLVAPAIKALDGRINTNVSLSGKLTNQLDLDLGSLTGDILAEVLSAGLEPAKTPVLNHLNSKFKFADLSKADLSGLKTALSFEDGKVKLRPFTLKYEDIEVELSGGHSFAMDLDYQMNFKVPAQYLGDDVNKLLAGIGDESLNNLEVPIKANLGGTYDKPRIHSDLKEQTREITVQLVDIQKEKYLNKGKEEVGNLISNVLSKDEGQNADGKQASNKNAENQNNAVDNLVKAKAKNLLGGLLNSKSRAVTAKDTLN